MRDDDKVLSDTIRGTLHDRIRERRVGWLVTLSIIAAHLDAGEVKEAKKAVRDAIAALREATNGKPVTVKPRRPERAELDGANDPMSQVSASGGRRHAG
jgi:hypothetical protein